MFLKVKVTTSAKKEEVKILGRDSLEVAVTEKPINNQANQRLIVIVSHYCGVSPKEVKIVKGAKKRNKIFKINTDE